ncbi:hypothetical protein [Pseudonocardia sp. KRD291]|uniref:hypothetical protein n=1 Tax=Pseudonocardia sp. KRD291 TaxID=2792007 RepID=UPI001C4A6E77|nr:hypothetical protein [Pseudonocardia sp. KRD291]MBW0102188.1 hypothetical protein [Pseudonocardia sp. KRD291]
MTDQDAVMTEIAAAIELSQGGHTATARERFSAIWEEIGPAADPFHRCVLAHHAADVQADVADELRWDLLALEAADQIGPGRAEEHHPSLALAGFYPSLHLNLADVYRRLGDRDRAGEHLDRAREAIGTLGDDGYGRMIRDGITRCAARLAETTDG